MEGGREGVSRGGRRGSISLSEGARPMSSQRVRASRACRVTQVSLSMRHPHMAGLHKCHSP
eukprot:7905735-Pyramimonas_sp.AAC.2